MPSVGRRTRLWPPSPRQRSPPASSLPDCVPISRKLRVPGPLPVLRSGTRAAPGQVAPPVGWSLGGRHSRPRSPTAPRQRRVRAHQPAGPRQSAPGGRAQECQSLRRFEQREDLAGDQQTPGAPSRPLFLPAPRAPSLPRTCTLSLGA